MKAFYTYIYIFKCFAESCRRTTKWYVTFKAYLLIKGLIMEKGQKIIVVLSTTALRWQIGVSIYMAL